MAWLGCACVETKVSDPEFANAENVLSVPSQNQIDFIACYTIYQYQPQGPRLPPSAAVLNARLLGHARLRHLQLLVAVADHGTLKRAAEHVGMSQPAATQAMGEFERLLESPLFERLPRGMRATAAGQTVLPVVRQILQALEVSIEALAAQQAGATGLPASTSSRTSARSSNACAVM